jgi:predicted metal-dependent hydrolase
MFAQADPPLVRALARYVVHNDPRASAVIGAFIEKNQHVIPRRPRRARRVVLRTAGRAHDLRTIFERLNAEYFEGQLDARITWGAAPRRRSPRRSIKMGSFAVEDRIIRIHPVLDHPSVPGYFVAWIVFHEMLHGKHAVVRKGDRRCFHSKEFLAEERTFGDYDRAAAWERANMDRLLGS